ncbi:hypothetical protein ABK040_005174 [Willaertia magna]
MMNGQSLEIKVDSDISINEFKEVIANQCEIPANQQRLIYQGKVLKDHTKLSDYKVPDGHTIHLVPITPSPSSTEQSSSSSHPTNTSTTGNQPPQRQPQVRIGHNTIVVSLDNSNNSPSGSSNSNPSTPNTTNANNQQGIPLNNPFAAFLNTITGGASGGNSGSNPATAIFGGPIGGGGNSGGGIDLGQLVSGVLGSVLNPNQNQQQQRQQQRNVNTGNVNNTGNQQQRQQSPSTNRNANAGNVVNNSVNNNTTVSGSNNEVYQRVELQQISTTINDYLNLMHQQEQNLITLQNLIQTHTQNNTNFTENERNSILNLQQTLQQPLSDMNSQIRNLQNMLNHLILPNSGNLNQSFTFLGIPNVNSLNLHVHTNANEINNLPQQLQRLYGMVNINQVNNIPTNIVNNSTTNTTTASTGTNGTENQHRERRGSRGGRNVVIQGHPHARVTIVTDGSEGDNILQNIPNVLQQILGGGATQNTTSQNNQQQTQQPQDISLNSLMERAMSSLGLNNNTSTSSSTTTTTTSSGENVVANNNEEKNLIDELVNVAIQELNLTDLLSIMTGNWTSLERTKPKLKEFILEKALKGNLENKNQVIEELLVSFEKHVDNNHDLQLEIASKTITEEQVLDRLIEILRFYLHLLFNLILENPEKYSEISNNLITVNLNDNYKFSNAINRYITLLIGEIVELLERNCQPNTSNEILYLLFNTLFTSAPPMLQQFYRQQGSGMIMQFINRRYQLFKNEYPNPKLSLMKPLTTTSTTTSSVGSSNTGVVSEPKKEEEKKKDEEVLMTDDDLLNSLLNEVNAGTTASSTSEEKKEEKKKVIDDEDLDSYVIPSVLSSSSISSSSSPTTNKVTTNITANDVDNNNWKKGLTEEEIKEIEDTLEEDETIMELTKKEEEISDNYKLSTTQPGYIKEEKEENTSNQGSRNNPKEEENVDLD